MNHTGGTIDSVSFTVSGAASVKITFTTPAETKTFTISEAAADRFLTALAAGKTVDVQTDAGGAVISYTFHK